MNRLPSNVAEREATLFAEHCPTGYRLGLNLPDVESKEEVVQFALAVLWEKNSAGWRRYQREELKLVKGHLEGFMSGGGNTSNPVYKTSGWMVFRPQLKEESRDQKEAA